MTLVGIDKVGLYTKGHVVKNLSGWSIKGGAKVGEAPPAFVHDADGNPVHGPGFYLNTPTFVGELSPKGLLVTFNPSKVLHSYHLLTDPAEVGRIGDNVQKTLKTHGILINVDDMQAVRVDLAKQAQLAHPLRSYVPALAHLRGKRMNGQQYPDGYSWRNTQREDVFYNKTREVLEKQSIAIAEDRLGRFEARWKKGRPLAKDMQLSAFRDLRRADPEHLADVYRQALHRDVFQTDPKAVQLVLNLDTDRDVYRQLKGQHRRGAVWQYLSMGSTAATIEAHGGLDAFGRFLLEAGDNPRTVRHTLQQLRARLQRDAFLNARRDKAALNVHTLLDELKHVFAA
jgi:hypothetical protein